MKVKRASDARLRRKNDCLAFPWGEARACRQHATGDPDARAVHAAAKFAGVVVEEASELRALPGRGISGVIASGPLLLGSTRLMAESGIEIAVLAEAARIFESEGHTVSWLAVNRPGSARVRGLFAFGAKLRPEAAEAIRSLQDLGLRAVMLSGDSRDAAETIARSVGVSTRNVRAEVLPGDKAAHVIELARESSVAMVGGGVNDAPALAAVNVGFAMGSGTDVAMQVAGITLMRCDPTRAWSPMPSTCPDAPHARSTRISSGLSSST